MNKKIKGILSWAAEKGFVLTESEWTKFAARVDEIGKDCSKKDRQKLITTLSYIAEMAKLEDIYS